MCRPEADVSSFNYLLTSHWSVSQAIEAYVRRCSIPRDISSRLAGDLTMEYGASESLNGEEARPREWMKPAGMSRECPAAMTEEAPEH